MKFFYIVVSLMAGNIAWYHINVPDVNMKTAAPISYYKSQEVLCTTQSFNPDYVMARRRDNYDPCRNR